ncbi:MAG: DUF5119 domain-containing protein [Bacteroidales bacterium]|nr:DUF5119 domain-containing protein [Bacteroidales bacterium]
MKMWMMIIAAIAVLCGCEHKELCYRHPHTAPVVIDVDWEKFIDKEMPTGMTVMIYPVAGYAAAEGIQPKKVLSNNIYRAKADLEEGIFNSIVFNQSESEFGTLLFRNMDNYNTAEVAINPAPTKWYTKTEEECVGYEPEWFGTDTFEGIEMTRQMILDVGTQTTFGRTVTEYELIYHSAENIVHTVNITVHLKNVYNLKSARAALQGLAEGYLLGKGTQNNKKITHLIEQWNLTTDVQDPTIGYITAKLLCFGLPGNHTAQPADNKFTLSLLLVDNKTQLDIPFEVGHLFEKTGEDNLEFSITISLADPLPDVKPEGGSEGGFSATVDDWGEEIRHDINI